MKTLKDGDRFIFTREPVNDETTRMVKCEADGIPTAFCEVIGVEANQLARWQLISKELEFSEVQLELALARLSNAKHQIELDRREPESVLIKSLIDAAVIGYIKCFNQAKGRKVKLEVREMFPLPQFKKMHEHHIAVRELRDSYIAHGGISDKEGSNMIACIDPKPTIGQPEKVVIAHSYFSIPSLTFLRNTLDLIRFVKEKHFEKLQLKLNDFCKKVVDDPLKYGVDSVFTTSS